MSELLTISRRWQFSVDLWADRGPERDSKDFDCTEWNAVVQACSGAEQGVVVADGEKGERVELEFNANHAAIIFVEEKRLLRPYFPGRSPESQDIEEFFCGGCGLRVGPLDGFLSRSMSRWEGFQLCGALMLSGSLPLTVPANQPGEAPIAVEWRDYPAPHQG